MEDINHPAVRLTAEQKQELIANWRHSGLSQKTFCIEKNIRYGTFVTWVSRSKKSKAKKSKSAQEGKSFAQLEISSSVSPFVELNFKNGNCVRIFPSVSADFIRLLIY